MLLKNTFIAFAFLLFSTVVHAQIGLGTKSISGYIEVNKQRINTVNAQNYTNTVNLNFAPSYGFFVGRKTLLAVQAAYLFRNGEDSNNGFRSGIYNQSQFSFGVGIRHYLNPEDKFAVFGQAGVNYTNLIQGFSYSNGKFVDVGLGLGGNFFLNNTVGLTAILSFNQLSDLNGGNRSTGFSVLQLNIGLENFINTESESAESDALVNANRKLIDCRLNYSIFSDNRRANFDFHLSYGHFITKSWILGATVDYQPGSYFDGNLSNIGVFSRYYIGLSNRFFVHPELRFFGYKASGGYYSDNKLKFGFYGGLGLSYFLKKNIAIEANILNLALQQSLTQYSYGPNIGMRYFLN